VQSVSGSGTERLHRGLIRGLRRLDRFRDSGLEIGSCNRESDGLPVHHPDAVAGLPGLGGHLPCACLRSALASGCPGGRVRDPCGLSHRHGYGVAMLPATVSVTQRANAHCTRGRDGSWRPSHQGAACRFGLLFQLWPAVWSACFPAATALDRSEMAQKTPRRPVGERGDRVSQAPIRRSRRR
jgi:hypothetical protein